MKFQQFISAVESNWAQPTTLEMSAATPTTPSTPPHHGTAQSVPGAPVHHAGAHVAQAHYLTPVRSEAAADRHRALGFQPPGKVDHSARGSLAMKFKAVATRPELHALQLMNSST